MRRPREGEQVCNHHTKNLQNAVRAWFVLALWFGTLPERILSHVMRSTIRCETQG